MNQEEFMRQLEELLTGISVEEREEALAYYRNYFEDAGIENEEKVLRELESPQKLAESIRKGLLENAEDFKKDAENFREDDGKEGKPVIGDFEKKQQEYKGTTDRTGTTVLIVVLLVLSSPVWLGLLGGLFGLIIGILGACFGIMVGFFAGGVACIGVTISLFVTGNVPAGLLTCGAGALMLSVGILALLALVQFCGRTLPWAVRGIVKLVKQIFGNNRKEKLV